MIVGDVRAAGEGPGERGSTPRAFGEAPAHRAVSRFSRDFWGPELSKDPIGSLEACEWSGMVWRLSVGAIGMSSRCSHHSGAISERVRVSRSRT